MAELTIWAEETFASPYLLGDELRSQLDPGAILLIRVHGQPARTSKVDFRWQDCDKGWLGPCNEGRQYAEASARASGLQLDEQTAAFETGDDAFAHLMKVIQLRYLQQIADVADELVSL